MDTQAPVTFDDDLLDRSDFCDRLQSFLSVEKDYVEGSLVVSLDGGFGSGKTTFIQMWRNRLLERRAAGGFEPMPVLLNAWESDHCGDPLVAILAGLVEAVKNWKGKGKPDDSKLKEAAKDVGWLAIAIANEFTSKVAFDAIKVGKFAEDKKEARKEPTPDFIQAYQDRVAALKRLKDGLASAFGGKELKVIVFVDELDRCRPDYAVAYLETIKHVFDIEGIAFVLAVHYGQLSGSARALFGADLDVEEYFRKFCHRSFLLPTPSKSNQRKLCGAYVERFLSVEGKRNSMLMVSERLTEGLTELAVALEMTPRQIQESFRILGYTTQKAVGGEDRGNLRWGIGMASMLLSIISVGRPAVFREVRDAPSGWKTLCKTMVETLGKDEAEWWVQIILSGSIGRNCTRDEVFAVVTELGFEVAGPDAIGDYLRDYGGPDAWPGRGEEFRRIAQLIDDARSF